MIPVRVPATFRPHIISDDCHPGPGHWLYGEPCPVCDLALAVDGQPVALVAVGIAPASQKERGWTNGGAVAVHTACTNTAPITGETGPTGTAAQAGVLDAR
ncbi:hypothetical protein [Nonomuraea basaltis]|uniref:hypothetical protein n=1 Tax=Nonomuraea basaltis TaxID=2495887 RepID=UPI00110C6527|nr:hypothetical protein [Nonomuraea basaltis]TMR91275.1 hypothetical protein EJK15_50685 [Nonomuraea basaltis]